MNTTLSLRSWTLFPCVALLYGCATATPLGSHVGLNLQTLQGAAKGVTGNAPAQPAEAKHDDHDHDHHDHDHHHHDDDHKHAHGDEYDPECLKCNPKLAAKLPPLPTLPSNADNRTISPAGEDVPSLQAHAVEGKVTVFDFTADWCIACRKIQHEVYVRLARGDALAYRKINIVDWDTPVSTRYLHEIETLPLVVVYGRNRKEVARFHGADLAALERAVAAAAEAR